MLFWIIAGLLAAIIGTFLGVALLRGGRNDVSAATYDLQVYRDQLKEVDRDLARGVIPEADAERVRTEIARRILAADTQSKMSGSDSGQPKGLGKGMAAACFAFLLLGTIGIYSQIGAPNYEDQPLKARFATAQNILASRPAQAVREAQLTPREERTVDQDFANLVKELRVKVQENPTDLRGQELLARNEATLGNYRAAYEAQEKVISLKGEAARGQDFTQYADLMIRAAQGYISPEADLALREAIARDPNDGFARYYMGLMLTQNGRPDMTFRVWRDLLEEGPENAPWIPPIRARIDDLAWIAGVNYTAPAPRGPSADDIQAAQELTADERAEMIQSMVASLSDRLATEGGTPAEWAQLISAYAVLGETDRSRTIWEEAQTVFADNPAALATVQAAATQAGL